VDNGNKCLSENDKSNEESENEDEKEEVVEIDEKNGNVRDTATIKTNITEDKKKKIIKELKEQKEKIDKLKEAIPKLIGEEKYNYIMELCSIGVRDNSKQEEMNDKIEQFVKDNCVNGNEEKMCDIYQLFIFECQYYKKQEQLSKL
jgi:coenzyme F420-reducing hydrogenase alpha subunit